MPSRARLALPLLLALTLPPLAAGCGGHDPNAPSRSLREDDQRWAEGALPTSAALPPEWRTQTDDRGAALDDCAAIDRSGLTLTGEAVATFELGERLFAIAGTQTFATEREARELVSAPEEAELADCVAEELGETFADEEAGEQLESARVEPAPAPAVGELARAVRVEADYTGPDATAPILVEVAWVQRGRSVLTLVAAGLVEEFPGDVRDRLLADFDERATEKPPP